MFLNIKYKYYEYLTYEYGMINIFPWRKFFYLLVFIMDWYDVRYFF